MARIADQSVLRKNAFIGYEIPDKAEIDKNVLAMKKGEQDMEIAAASEARAAEKHPLDIESKKTANEMADLNVKTKKGEMATDKKMKELRGQLAAAADPDEIYKIALNMITEDAAKGVEAINSFLAADGPRRQAVRGLLERIGSVGYGLKEADNPEQFYNQYIEKLRQSKDPVDKALLQELERMGPWNPGKSVQLMTRATDFDKALDAAEKSEKRQQWISLYAAKGAKLKSEAISAYIDKMFAGESKGEYWEENPGKLPVVKMAVAARTKELMDEQKISLELAADAARKEFKDLKLLEEYDEQGNVKVDPSIADRQ